jgi:hypothetical protein
LKKEVKMPKGKSNLLGAWAFLIGVILAVIFGFFSYPVWISWIMVVIGLLIGILNIKDTESQSFLMAAVVLVIVSYFGGSVFANIKIAEIPFLSNILTNMLILFVPATIIVALKSVFSMAHD